MKTKLNLKTLHATSVIFLLLLFSLMPSMTKAQTITGIMTGTGMGVCSAFSFSTTTTATTITPLTYSNQNYACTGLNDNDISFNPQGTSWRVEIKSWQFVYKPSTGTGSLSVTDSNTGLPATYTFTTNDGLSSTDYSTQNGWPSCRFIKNGTSYISTAYYRRDNWTITSP